MDDIILVDALPRKDELEMLVRTRTDIDLRIGKIHSIRVYDDKITFIVGDSKVVVKRRDDVCVTS